jgi:metal iron transporter
MVKFGKFVGPGTIITVAYIDPDNFQTAVSSGEQYKYKLLFMVLIFNLIAIHLQASQPMVISEKESFRCIQALAAKLGSVTEMDLSQMNRAQLPSWLNYGLWLWLKLPLSVQILAKWIQISVVIHFLLTASQVIGTAIAINILIPKIPLTAGCALAIADTLFILLFYRPDGSLRGIRAFELFISVFVLGVFISFGIELSLITGTAARHVMGGFLPSREILVSNG